MSDHAGSEHVDVVLEALEHALEKLARLPRSVDVDSLTLAALEHQQRVLEWPREPPTPSACEETMRQVLALHSMIDEKARR